ncbi:MAG: stage II sporulation protein M [Thermoleophilia bacterium]
MKVERFIAEREHDWRELEALVQARGRRRRRRPAGEVLRLGALYRGAAADLALARRGHPGDPIVPRLESLVARARQAVYCEEPRGGSLRTFLARTYWLRVRERPVALLLAAALLLVPAALTIAWSLSDTGAAVALVPEQFRGAVEPVGDTGMTAGQTAAFSSAVMTNNIQVTFLAFAAGILFGLGTAFIVAYNGAVLGAVAGGAIANGNGVEFAEFVTAHGVIELSCVIVAAAAGMRMGYALVAPGPRPRSRALAEEARTAIAIVLGTVPWVILAGIIEGFVTRAGFGLAPGIVLGFGVGAIYWGLVLVRGRPQDEHGRRGRAAGAPLTAAPAPSR